MISRLFPALALLGLLAACDGHRVVSRGFDVAYSSPEAAGGAAGRLWVEVLGTPRADWDSAALKSAVIDTFRLGGASWLNTTYTGDAALAQNSSYRLRVLFNPTRGSPNDTVCTKAATDGDGAPGEVFMALCRDEKALSYGWGFLSDLGSLEAERERLERFLHVMAMVILPDENPLRADDRCPVGQNC